MYIRHCRRRARWLFVGRKHCPPQRRFIRRRHVVRLAEAILQIRPVKCDQSGSLLNRDVQQRDVAEANEHLWIAADHVEIDPIQYPHDAIPAAGTPHGRRFRIGKRRHQFGGARCIIAGQVSARAIDIAVRLDAKAAFLHSRKCPVDPLAIHRPRRRHDADRISSSQRLWLDN